MGRVHHFEDDKSSEVVNKFCYLGDMISAGGVVEESIAGRIRCGWKKFRECLSVLTSLCTKGKIFQACVRSVVLYGSETLALKEEDLGKLERNDMMVDV